MPETQIHIHLMAGSVKYPIILNMVLNLEPIANENNSSRRFAIFSLVFEDSDHFNRTLGSLLISILEEPV